MENVDKVKKKRTTHRRNVTKIVNKVDELLKTDPVDKRKLKHYQNELIEKRSDLKDLDNEILELLTEHADEQTADKEMDDALEYKEKLSCALISIEEALEKLKLPNLQRSDSRESLASIGSLSSIGSQGKRVNVKLPKLELRKFNGKIYEWQEFWDGFCSAIHENEELANVDKFKYLKSFLEEPARSVIAGMPITDAEYGTAIDLLKKRYARPLVIERTHINELTSLSPVFSEKNVARLRALHDQIETHFRGLEALGVDKYTYSSYVVPLLMEKVPENIRINMIRFSDKEQMEWMLDDMLVALEKEVSVRESHMPLIVTKGNGKAGNEERGSRPKQNQETGTANMLFAGNGKRKCVFCLEEHSPETCITVKDPEERKKILRKYAKCYVCLNSAHRAFDCRSRIRCRICNGKHHVAICSGPKSKENPVGQDANKEAQPKPSSPPLNANATSWVGSTYCGESVALQTALAKVDGKRESKVRVLFDTGSHQSFITAKAVGRIGLRPTRSESLGIQAFGKSEAEVKMRDIVEFSLVPLHGGKPVKLECFVVDEIASIPNEHVELIKGNYHHLHKIYFSDVCRNEETLQVDILIGSNFVWEFQQGETVRGGPQEPVAVKTTLGWVLSGPLKGGKTSDSTYKTNVNFISSHSKSDKQQIEERVHTLWDLDSLGIREKNEVHETLIDNIFFTGKRYQVGLPWKVGHGDLPPNFEISLMRLNNLLRKLRKDPSTLQKYNDIILEQEQSGIIERVSELESAKNVHYLAHQAVIREEAETTKVRVVFDASCKARKSGVSLNDCLHVGPPMTPLLFEILLRFRENKVALVGDIEKAFLNIEIIPEDRDCLRFLWVDDVQAEDPKIVVFRYQTVVFGVNASPFILNAVLRHHIEHYKEIDPNFVTKLVEGFYVDDLVSGCSNTHEAFALFQKAKGRLQEGGFKLRKWKTNDPDLQLKIHQNESENVLKELKATTDDSTFAKETLGQVKEAGEKTKVLGITWDTQKDLLEFDLRKLLNEGKERVTKRGILSTLATLFDPQGIISPVAVKAKVLFQELCVEKLGWDDPLPADKASIWEMWLNDLYQVGTISIPRCVYDESEGEILSCQLHGFGDASKKAYSAVIYLVYETSKGIFTKLLCSKTRVAPLKSLTIPRLELMSARILAVLMNTVRSALSSQVKIDSVKYWLDSKTALYWIYNNGQWKQFVQHRVNEILRLSRSDEWGHVSGVDNPADLGSRGVTASQLRDSKLWWEGPHWLRKGKAHWPKDILVTDSDEVKEERKKTNVLSVVTEKQARLSQSITVNDFSSLKKLLKVTAWVKRFIENLKLKKEGKEINVGLLSVNEIEGAEKMLIKDAQEELKQSPNFKKLCTNLDLRDREGILVCHGRLENADLETEAKFPIILPRDHKITELIVLDCHNRVHHCKLRATLSELRSRFWVTRGRQYVKKILIRCFICRKLEGKAFSSPPAAPLPEFRVSEAAPFSSVGIDFAGPLYYKANGGMSKCYIALFSCSITRALHLELINDLATPTFICCLRRFCARRGTPAMIVSDNAKTFKSAAKLLKKLQKDQVFADFLESKRIHWKFNLELSPWWGGQYERMVGLVKRCLRKVLGNAKLSFDELNTVLTEIENTLNLRPLTYQYEELGVEVLTPSHLLFGRRLSPLSEGIDPIVDDDDENNSSLSRRFLYLTRKLSHFWNRWRKEYLVGLREAHKLGSKKLPCVNKGDLVLVHEDNVKRGMWKTAVVEELIVGKDGVVRGAKVRRAGKGKSETLCRPLQKLYPLETAGKKTCQEGQKGQEGLNEVEKSEKNRNPKGGRPSRAAAKDAQWRVRLMLDS